MDDGDGGILFGLWSSKEEDYADGRSLSGQPLAAAACTFCSALLLLLVIVVLAALGSVWPRSLCLEVG